MTKSELNLTNILTTMKEAMHKTFEDIYRFVGDPKDRIHAEYLFTVNVAQTISNLHIMPSGTPHPIRLEKPTKQLMEECFPYVELHRNGFRRSQKPTLLNLSEQQLTRSGRVDVVCYEEFQNQGGRYIFYKYSPLCIIELKAFNQSKGRIEEDLLRNIEFLNLKANIGENLLKFTVFASFESCESDVHDENKDKVRQNYENILRPIKAKYSQIEYLLEIFTVQESPGDIDIYWEKVGDNYIDLSEIDTSTKHHYVGVIITFNRKEVSSLIDTGETCPNGLSSQPTLLTQLK